MKVAVVVEQLRRRVAGGIGTYARGLLRGLAGLDHHPDVVLHASRASAAPDPLREYGWPVVTVPLPSPVVTRLWGRGWLAAPAADLVHATSLAVPPVRDRPLVVMVHDLAWRTLPEAYPRRGRRWHDAALERALAAATAFVVPARGVADDLVEAGAPAAAVHVIEEGCDHLPPADTDGAGEVLRRLGVIDGYLLTVSTLEPRKNLRRLVEAYSAARPSLPEPWPLVVVGPKGWGDAFDGASPPHGVVLAGEITDATLAGLYRGARCFAYVPLAEGFGLPPVEAMRECVPVVSAPTPSTGGAALEVDPLDVGGIADALVRAASDDRLRAELVTGGLLRAGELTWDRAARAHVDLWESLAG